MSKLVTISLSPNVEGEDILRAAKTLVTPWKWKAGKSIQSVELWFRHHYGTENVCSYNSGRSALYELLKAYGIGEGDEVIIQAFTCVAVPNSVIWTGATPVYADTDERFNIDPASLRKKITAKTKAIIVQHTFGIPAQIETIQHIAREHNIVLVEDCAHALYVSVKGNLLGTFGDGAIMSFGRDKVLSSVFGGVAILPKKTGKVFKNVQQSHDQLNYPAFLWIFQQLFHPVAFALILPFYLLGPGKVLLVVLQKIGLLSFPVYPEEKRGEQPSVFPTRYPNGLANLLVLQLNKIERYQHTRKQIVAFYTSALKNKQGIVIPSGVESYPLLRFPILVKNPETILQACKKQGIYLGNWYHTIVDPKGVDYHAISFNPHDCPTAEYQSEHILNLPTRISLPEAQRIVSTVIQYT